MKNNLFFKVGQIWMGNFDHQSLIHLICLKSFFCTWLICMAFYLSPIFLWKLKSNISKHLQFWKLLQIKNFKLWTVTISYFTAKCNFKKTKRSSLKSSTTSPSQIFHTPMFYMTLRQVCESLSLLWGVTILVKCQLRFNCKNLLNMLGT
jgi:hypothetical protein